MTNTKIIYPQVNSEVVHYSSLGHPCSNYTAQRVVLAFC